MMLLKMCLNLNADSTGNEASDSSSSFIMILLVNGAGRGGGRQWMEAGDRFTGGT